MPVLAIFRSTIASMPKGHISGSHKQHPLQHLSRNDCRTKTQDRSILPQATLILSLCQFMPVFAISHSRSTIAGMPKGHIPGSHKQHQSILPKAILIFSLWQVMPVPEIVQSGSTVDSMPTSRASHLAQWFVARRRTPSWEITRVPELGINACRVFEKITRDRYPSR